MSSEAAKATKDAIERRAEARRVFGVPLRVQGHAPDGSAWEEMTNTLDVAFGGVAFKLGRRLEPGQVVMLLLPLPKAFRRYDLSDPSYRSYALVRDSVQVAGGQRVGVVFLGRTPPKGYAQNPGGRYLLPHDPAPKPGERRQHRRLQVFLNLKIQRAQTGAHPAQEEQTVAENLSRRGARVLTSMNVRQGEIVTVLEIGGSYRTRAEVRSVTLGRDRITRLGLLFHQEVPDRLIST